jgi:hypothetical protein
VRVAAGVRKGADWRAFGHELPVPTTLKPQVDSPRPQGWQRVDWMLDVLWNSYIHVVNAGEYFWGRIQIKEPGRFASLSQPLGLLTVP